MTPDDPSPKPAPSLQERVDYYIDELGRLVFTEAYHLRRGTCCGNACRHCPFEHANVPPGRKRGPPKGSAR